MVQQLFSDSWNQMRPVCGLEDRRFFMTTAGPLEGLGLGILPRGLLGAAGQEASGMVILVPSYNHWYFPQRFKSKN